MVKETEQDGKSIFICEECGFAYQDRQWAEKCQAWCSEHQACNLDITEHGFVPE